MKEVKVRGSSSIYTVKFDDEGGSVCYQANGQLCIGWKNSRAPKTCKHVKMALAGVDGLSDERVERLPVASGRSFVEPMLASKMESAVVSDWGEWAIEEKFDGHRAMVMVVASSVTAWSRSGKRRELPRQVVDGFSRFPNGIYDGELMGREGGSFADVRRIESQKDAYFVVFDVVNFMGENIQSMSYADRQDVLWGAFERSPRCEAVRKSESVCLKSEADVVSFVSSVWARGGEGAILKRLSARYQAGKRSADWVKVKKGGSRVVVVTGFESGKRGPYSTVVCRDPEDGMTTAVKNESKIDAKPADIGRRLWIDYTEKTPAAFVNPHSDRWEDK